MGKFMLATFAVLGWAFWEMSGGSDFVPEERVVAVAEAEPVQQEPAIEVTRGVTQDLVTISLPVAEPTPTISEPQVDAQVVLASVTEAVETVVEEPVVEPVVEVVAPAPADLRYVSGSVVNMRGGPSTNFGVVDKLPRGTLTEVVEVNSEGWARIIVPSTGLEGWMAERFLQR